MKRLLTIFAAITSIQQVSAQYYIRGEVKNENKQPLQNVRIYMPEKKMLYASGTTGGFGIPTSNTEDSLVFSLDGYYTQGIKIKTQEYQNIILHPTSSSSHTTANRMVSITRGATGNIFPISYYLDESYTNLAENDFIKTSAKTNTEFAMRIDKASYSNIRRFLNQDTKVPIDAVRIDEMLNYFNFNYKEPEAGQVFRMESQTTDCPWNADHRLLFLNISGKKINLDHIPPSNLVFLIDVSGSMDLPYRLPLLKEAFQLLVKNLRKQDTVSIVTYGGIVSVWLPPTSGKEKQKISKAIEDLNASGDTPGEAAIRMAYHLAEQNFIKDGNNRIILATDGDFNIGQKSEEDLENLISKEKQSGVLLTCLGVGMGNYKDSKIEVLSKKGNGNFAYIDDIHEAEKVLVTEFTQTLYSIASNVYVNARFNPASVSEYRLIGYDNKKTVLDQNNFELEGGEIGSGTGNTVIFEIIPAPGKQTNIGNFDLHYHVVNDTSDHVIRFTAPQNYVPFDSLSKDLRFATAVAMFGLKLRESKYFPSETEWNEIKSIADKATVPGSFLETEFSQLVEKAKKIYGEKRKRRFWKKD